ncbi:MAG TPA: hypothetical protein VGO91_10725 [Pyrinomonadaceae bacterium]|jgi:hypothetical protein|nr:hypothetical protein [Pyrinomonadaceae bacterium]
MLLALVLVLIATVGGTLATYWYDEASPLAARICAGASTGLAAFGLVGFIFASLLGLGSVALVLTALVIASPVVLLRDRGRKARVRADLLETERGGRNFFLRPTQRASIYFIFYMTIAVLLWLAFDRVMFARADGIYTGVLNNYGDLPFHLSVITSFAHGGNFPPEDPTFMGVRFTYPFIVDFVAACLVRAGAGLREAMLMENFVLGMSFVGLLHRWGFELLRDRIAALLTPLLVVLSGGLGWVLLFVDARERAGGILDVLAQPTHSFTIIPETTWRWGNAVTSLLLPQRSFLLGLPLAIIVFMQWWASLNNGEEGTSEKVKVKSKKAKNKKMEAANSSSSPLPVHFLLSPSSRRMLAAGVMAGLLPLVHAHTFVVVMAMGGCLAWLFWNWRAWAIFFVAATLVAVPQLWWSTHGSSIKAASFFGWQTGWDRGTENIFWFWFKNTGLFIPLTVTAILWRGKEYLVPRRLLLFFLPFTLCFIIPNLVRLAPWIWDNVKVLFYWYVASAPLIALLLAYLWRQKGAARAAAVALFVSLTLAGALDVWGVVSRSAEFREFDRDGIAFAEMIKTRTEPRSLILQAPIHNHPVFLTGRRALMGYPGHIWTHGLDYVEREREIKQIYAGGPGADNLLARYGVDYVVVGPLEKLLMPVNDSFFAKYAKVGEAGEYRLYKITSR